MTEDRDLGLGEAQERVAAVEGRLAAAIRAADARTAADQYTETGVLLLPGLRALVGRAAIEAHFREVLGSWDLTVESRTEEVLLAGDLAVLRGSVVQEANPKGGGRRQALPLRHLLVLRRGDDGEWRIAWDLVQQGVHEGAQEGMGEGGRQGWLARIARRLGKRR